MRGLGALAAAAAALAAVSRDATGSMEDFGRAIEMAPDLDANYGSMRGATRRAKAMAGRRANVRRMQRERR